VAKADSPTIDAFLGELAARQPTPGGGAAAGLASALGAALLAMVANYTTGKRYVEVENEMRSFVAELEDLRSRSLQVMREDEVAFAAVGAAYALPRDTDQKKRARDEAIQQALLGAVVPPRAIASIVERLAEIAASIAEKGNRNVLSDVGVGAACAGAALDGAILNVAINAAQIDDQRVVTELAAALADMDALKGALGALVDDVRRKVSD
jgi:formiminotetrahydrofolate cyclodeaminase